MTLIVHPHTFPLEDRHEHKTMFNVENNMGNHFWFSGTGLSPVQEWIQEQAFTVVMYRGWWHTFYFDHPNSFLLTKLVWPNYCWHIQYNQPAQFDEFMDPVRRQNPYYEELERHYGRR